MILTPSASVRASIRWKLACLVVASVGAAVAIVAAVSAVSNGRRAMAEQAHQFQADATLVASVSAEATAARSRPDVYTALRALSHMPGVTYARVETLDHIPLAETGAGVRLAGDAQFGAKSG